jgi:hypothetical protein
MAVAVQRRAVGEDAAGQHHLARAPGRVDRDLRPGVVQQPGVVEVAVAQEDRVRRVRVIGEQPRHGRDGPVGDQLLAGRAKCLEGVERIPVDIHQREPDIQDQPRAAGGDLDAGAADLFGAAVHGEDHLPASFR